MLSPVDRILILIPYNRAHPFSSLKVYRHQIGTTRTQESAGLNITRIQ
jgi:hypothetical protein